MHRLPRKSQRQKIPQFLKLNQLPNDIIGEIIAFTAGTSKDVARLQRVSKKFKEITLSPYCRLHLTITIHPSCIRKVWSGFIAYQQKGSFHKIRIEGFLNSPTEALNNPCALEIASHIQRKRLHTLEITGGAKLTSTVYRTLFTQAQTNEPYLSVLEIGDFCFSDEISLLANLPNLSNLSLKGRGQSDMIDISILLEHPNLEIINLYNCNVSNYDPSLRHPDMVINHYCELVSQNSNQLHNRRNRVNRVNRVNRYNSDDDGWYYDSLSDNYSEPDLNEEEMRKIEKIDYEDHDIDE